MYVFVDRCLSFCIFLLAIVLSVLLLLLRYRFWLPLWYLQTLLISNALYMCWYVYSLRIYHVMSGVVFMCFSLFLVNKYDCLYELRPFHSNFRIPMHDIFRSQINRLGRSSRKSPKKNNKNKRWMYIVNSISKIKLVSL